MCEANRGVGHNVWNSAGLRSGLLERAAEADDTADARPSTEPFGPGVRQARITSYNVCYTKLLRIHENYCGTAG